MATDRERVTTLEALGERLRAVDLRLELPGADAAAAVRDELSDQLTDYLVPRLRRLDAPLLAVLGGSTGSGKSTITNALAGSIVSPAGVLRPTTRGPVLICHPDDEAWFASDELLPSLPRLTGDGVAPTAGALKIAVVPSLEPGVALLDAPDIDSVEEANRELATQLLAAADLWLFVTTAVRYADAVPWEFLTRARDRGTALGIVVNRLPSGADAEILPHLASMLETNGFADVPLFPVDQTELVDGELPPAAVEDLRATLELLARDSEERAIVVAKTLDGAVASVPPRAEIVAAASLDQEAAVDGLRLTLERVVDEAKAAIAADLAGGAMLRGEVLDRWQELIGASQMMQALQSRIGALRDRLTGLVRRRAAVTDTVQGEITSTLEQLIVDHADRAALAIVEAWRHQPGGATVAADPALQRASSELRTAVAPEIRAWQGAILELVAEKGAGKRTVARALAYGVNGIGVTLMIVLFAQTGGITGGEVAVASGTATISQALLNALFGEQAVRELIRTAGDDLQQRIDGLLDVEGNRFRSALWAAANPPGAAAELRSAIDDLEEAT